MKKGILIVCLCFCVFILFGCSSKPSKVNVDITPENFKKYFTVSLDLSNEKQDTSLSYMGMNWYDFTGDLSLSINSKFPCEIHNVEFSITAEGGASTKGFVGKKENVTFKGTIPQNGSYSSTKHVSIEVASELADGLTYSEYDLNINSVSGFIVIDSKDAESIK